MTIKDLIKDGLSKWACHHHWKLYKEVDVKDWDCNVVEVRQTLYCPDCGKIKQIKL